MRPAACSEASIALPIPSTLVLPMLESWLPPVNCLRLSFSICFKAVLKALASPLACISPTVWSKSPLLMPSSKNLRLPPKAPAFAADASPTIC